MEAITPFRLPKKQKPGKESRLVLSLGQRNGVGLKGQEGRGDEKRPARVFVPLPDSMAAGEGAARSWGRRGDGTFSHSPAQQRHGRAQQKQHSVMDRLADHW